MQIKKEQIIAAIEELKGSGLRHAPVLRRIAETELKRRGNAGRKPNGGFKPGRYRRKPDGSGDCASG